MAFRKGNKLRKGLKPANAFKKGHDPWNKGNISYERANRITIDGEIVYEHRYIYETIYGNIPKGMIIHHIDGNNKNNNILNLRLMTQSDHAKLHCDKIKEEIKNH